jgi:transposase
MVGNAFRDATSARRPVVIHVGIDLGRRQSHACTRGEDGKFRHIRFPTTREALTKLMGGRTGRVLLEAGANSEWVARHLELLGWEVIVGDPNFAPMYADRNRKVKTDRRDAEALLQACEKGTYRHAHRLSDEARRMRIQVQGRKILVRSRGRGVVRARAAVHALGLPAIPGGVKTFVEHWKEAAFPPDVAEELSCLGPVIHAISVLSSGIEQYDEMLDHLAARIPDVQRLMTVPGIKAVIAATWVATLDNPDRFTCGEEVAAYLGLVPTVWSSSESHHQGGITKRGPAELRSLLVQAGWAIYRSKSARARPLRDWARKCGQRRGDNVAVTALARRLAVILYAIWRDQTTYDATRVGPRSTEAA